MNIAIFICQLQKDFYNSRDRMLFKFRSVMLNEMHCGLMLLSVENDQNLTGSLVTYFNT